MPGARPQARRQVLYLASEWSREEGNRAADLLLMRGVSLTMGLLRSWTRPRARPGRAHLPALQIAKIERSLQLRLASI